jgi:DNA-binding transcriptional regulator YiaG
VEIPRCQTCGELIITTAVDELANDALRAKLHLLTPAQIREGIHQLGLKQQDVAEQLGVAPETISRWVTGALIQSRAMDNLLRLYFALPQVRDVLQGENQDPMLGAKVRENQNWMPITRRGRPYGVGTVATCPSSNRNPFLDNMLQAQ